MATSQKSFQIVQQYFLKKKQSNPRYSLGVLAQQLNVSPSYASRLVNGTRPFSAKHLPLLEKSLEMDAIAMDLLKKSILSEKRLMEGFQADVKSGDNLIDFSVIENRHLFLLEDWHYLAILELSTCEVFYDCPEWIARKIDISEARALAALKRLKTAQLLVQKEGRWKKNEDKIRFPDVEKNLLALNRYQRHSLRKIYQTIALKTQRDQMAARLALGGTVAVNSSNVKKAKDILSRAAMEAMQVLTEGECDQVCQFALHLTPITES